MTQVWEELTPGEKWQWVKLFLWVLDQKDVTRENEQDVLRRFRNTAQLLP